ncbi:hypothetical protein B0H99_10737 [Planomicrobium soli]|uniref:Uncharacterized protein n=1 Tax=Planomicrobium soli TaxID=1176648 RepID=A0A2P8GQG7_9BACL|nr:hypothetical protein [Planomicrobium soli]PSL36216.1 hypothetical protein B0H99_10737 [Planomicrobium soli]
MWFFKKNENASIKKIRSILFLIFASLLIAGCSANSAIEENGTEAEETVDKSEQAIRAVIEKEFNGPDEKYNELWDAMEEAQVSDQYNDDYEAFLESPESQNLVNYVKETYAPYFTENGYENFVNTSAFMYSGFDHDYKLNPSTIEISQNEKETTLYNIAFQVNYTDENGESDQFNFKGKAIAPEEGKIGKIEYLDGFEDGLLQELQNNE